MSKYTTTLYHIVKSGFDLGLRQYPIFDEEYRPILNKEIIDYYLMFEIGQETPFLFRHYLNTQMQLIMPKYNIMYKAQQDIITYFYKCQDFQHNFFEKMLTFFAFSIIIGLQEVKNLDNKYIFAKNLQRLMASNNVDRNDIANALGISYFTVSDWVKGKKYPRMDKVELLANYFGVLKSDLIEEEIIDKPQLPPTVAVTEGEQMLLDLFRLVPEDKQQMVLQMIRVALNTK